MGRKIRLTLVLFMLLTILVTAIGTVNAAQRDHVVASPFEGDSTSLKGFSSLGGRVAAVSKSSTASDLVDLDAALIAGAEYLKYAQADVTEDNAGNGNTDGDPDDGGWDWVMTSPNFTHSTSGSPTNIYGATAMGLYYAYLETSDATYKTAMQDAADVMSDTADIYSAADLVFLMRFQDLSGVTPDVYQDAAKAKFDARITTQGSATDFAEYIRDFRAGKGYENGIIPWDIGTWVVAAQMLENRYPSDSYDYAQAADDMAEVIYQDSFQQDPGYFDLTTDKNKGWDSSYGNLDYWWFSLGITGLIDAFEAASAHTAEIPGLVNLLLDCQYPGGGFSYCYGANTDDEDWQSTAYAVMSLARVDQATYQTEINYASYWLGATQDDSSGGWVYSSSGNHYPEVGGECTSALYFGKAPSEVWVDDDYTSSSYGGHLWGYDAFDNIQDGVDAVDGSTVNVAAGTYSETVVIDKSLTLRGATYAANKNGYAVPSNYAWDDTVESIIQVDGDETVVTITSDDVKMEGFVVQALNRSSSGDRHLVEVQADGHGKDLDNIVIRNNVIGPNTNFSSQDGKKGRMNLYIAINQYQETPWGLTNSLIAGNKIFGSEGNGDAVFIWGAYYAYGARNPSPMTGTVIEDNEICTGHRAGIEAAGGISDLIIRDNDIHDFTGLSGDDTNALKYGSGILLIRGSSDKEDCNGLGPVNLTIEDNEIYNCEKNAVYMGPNNQSVAVNSNDLHDNGWDGIRVDLIGNYWNPDFESDIGPYTCLGGSQNVSASSNSIENNGAGVQVIGTPTNTFELDAEYNWWGDASGPEHSGNSGGTGDKASDNVDYDPWLGDEPLWKLVRDASSGGVILLEANTFYCSDVVIDKPLTIRGQEGTVIGPCSPGTVVTATNVTIEDLTLDGDPTDTGNSTDPGILVKAGADNLTVEDCEILHWADGIEVEGDVTSLKVVGNWIHDNTDAGLQVDSDVSVDGTVTIEGNLFKDSGTGIRNDGSQALDAQYNSWGALTGPASGDISGSSTVTTTNFTFAELFLDVDPDTEATHLDVNESDSFTVTVKADAEKLYALEFELTYEADKLQFDGMDDDVGFKGSKTCVTNHSISGTVGTITYLCSREDPDTEYDAEVGDVLDIGFTATGAGLTGTGTWTALFDIAHAEADTKAGAEGGIKVYVNNAGFGDPSDTDRDITDTNDGEIEITGIAKFDGFVDLQGRTDDSGATIDVYDQTTQSGATKLASGTSAKGGGYTTDYIGSNLLTIGSDYWFQVDAALFLPTTPVTETVYYDSHALDTRPFTTLGQVKLLGGDASDDDEIDVTDATCIGNQYGSSSPGTCDSSGSTDVNGDGVVNLLDLVLMCGNYNLSSSPWTP